jgi:hypothetical protein
MSHIYNPETTIYFLAHDGEHFVPGKVMPDQSMDSGLPTLETFDSLDALNTRLSELGQPPMIDDTIAP